MTVQIRNTIRSAAGRGIAGVSVTVELTWDTSLSPVIKADDSDMFLGPAATITDGSGDWSMLVIENTELSPAGSLYKVTESNEGSVGNVYYIDVPVSDDPVWVGDVLVEPPAWEEVDD